MVGGEVAASSVDDNVGVLGERLSLQVVFRADGGDGWGGVQLGDAKRSAHCYEERDDNLKEHVDVLREIVRGCDWKGDKTEKYRRDEESRGLLYTRSSPFFPRSHLTSHHIRASPAFILEHSRIPCTLFFLVAAAAAAATIRDIRYAHSDTDRYMQLSNLIL